MSGSVDLTSVDEDGRTTGVDSRLKGEEDSSPLQSKSSSRLGFDVKSTRGRKKRDSSMEDEPGSHRVTFTVTIAQAVPTVKMESEASEGGTTAPSRASNPASTDDDDGRSSRKKRIMEAPRAQHLYHLEYTLVPEESDQTVKTDLVSFGVAAKIFTERQEAKVIKTWQEGEQTWVAWTHCHTVTVTEELLKKLFTHTLELRIWDTRDKVGTRAKMDRPRAFKFPPVKGDDHTGGVKTLVIKQSKSFEKMQPKKCYIDRPLPSQPRLEYDLDPIQLQFHKDAKALKEKKHREKERSEGREGVPAKLNEYLDKAGHRITEDRKAGTPEKRGTGEPRDYSRLSRLAGESPKPDSTKGGKPPSRAKSRSPHKPSSPDSIKQQNGRRSSTPKVKGGHAEARPSSHQSGHTGAPEQQDTDRSNATAVGAPVATLPIPPPHHTQGADQQPLGTGESATMGRLDSAGGPKRRDKKKEKEAQLLAEHIKKHGKAVVPIRMAKFFAGMQTITERLEKTSDTIPDMFVSVSLNKPLMSEDQKKSLNPLVVKVHSATNMPDKPMLHDELRMRCEAAYIQYNLFKQGVHRSVGRQQDRNIYWDDINVFLTGPMENAELQEYLSGPALQIEIHDRDRIPEKQKLKATLFGDDLEDEKISNVGTVSSKRTLHNAFDGRDKPWDPCGVAKFDLSGLLTGEQVIHLKVPIHQSPVPDVLGSREGKQDGKLMGVQGAVDGPVDSPLPPGHYLDSEAMLKIKVEVAHPLVTPTQLATKQQLISTKECPFSRMVFKFPYQNVQMLNKLASLITSANASALGLDDMPSHVIEAALSTYKLSLEQQQSHNLDIVTGFQVLDSQVQVFVIEGLREKAIKHIWESVPKEEGSDIDILYNSNLCFRERLYGPLDVDLCRIKLHEPMSVIVQQPLLYIRDMVPKACFEALVKLDQLCKMDKLRDAYRSDLFPTAEMVVSMSREFGVPLTAEDFEDMQPQMPKIEDEAPQFYAQATTSRVWTPIDHQNEPYLDQIAERAKTGAAVIDYERENKSFVRERSNLNKLQRSKTLPPTVKSDVKVAHNYSSQSLNSTEQGKERLRQILAQDPSRRYTYCPDYHHSMTVVPTNVEAVKKSEEQASKDSYKTPKGWVYPGRKTFQESNKHPKKPDTARVEELQKSWVENILHAKYRPVLERDRYKWTKRNRDFNIWEKPHPLFGSEPATIHLAGEKLRQERLEAGRTDLESWKSRIVVEDVRGHFHRCATDTEMLEKGRKASNQIDRLRGMLKDNPNKYSLRKPGFHIKDIAPLNVVLNPSVDTAARRAGLPIRPAIDNEFDQKVKGLVPGPYEEYSWLLQKNVIPVYDYEHHKYKASRGHDFNVYHKERSGLHKRKAGPLTDEEYDTHLFPILKNPGTFVDQYGNTFFVPDVEEFKKQASSGFPGKQVTMDTIDSGLGITRETSKQPTMVES